MKKFFVSFVMAVAFLNLFAEGVSKGAKACSVYQEIYREMRNNTFDNSDNHIPFFF